MRCDGSPDPTEQGEINTYINLRLEDNENDSIEMVLKKCELDSSVSIIGMTKQNILFRQVQSNLL